MSLLAHLAMLMRSGGGPGPDPEPGEDWLYTTAQIHFDRPEGSLDFTDDRGFLWRVTNGDARITTADSRFGIGSMICTGNTIIFNERALGRHIVGARDFRIEGFARMDHASARGIFCTALNASAQGMHFGYNTDSNRWDFYFAGVVRQSGPATRPNGWFHWCVYRKDAGFVVAIDGVAVIEWNGRDSGGTPYLLSRDHRGLYLGAYYSTGQPWRGYIDEVRVMVGKSGPEAPFDPPAAPFAGVDLGFVDLWTNDGTLAGWPVSGGCADNLTEGNPAPPSISVPPTGTSAKVDTGHAVIGESLNLRFRMRMVSSPVALSNIKFGITSNGGAFDVGEHINFRLDGRSSESSGLSAHTGLNSGSFPSSQPGGVLQNWVPNYYEWFEFDVDAYPDGTMTVRRNGLPMASFAIPLAFSEPRRSGTGLALFTDSGAATGAHFDHLRVRQRPAPPAGAHQSYRVLVTANNGDPTYTSIQEVEFIGPTGADETIDGSAFDGGAGVANSGAETAFDDNFTDPNNGTCWVRSGTSGGATWVGYRLPEPVVVRRATVTCQASNSSFTGGPGRAPRDFKIQGLAADGVTWVDLKTVVGETGWSSGETRTFDW